MTSARAVPVSNKMIHFLSSVLVACLLHEGEVCVAAVESEPVCVIKSQASLRRGPGKEFAVTWDVPKYMPLLKVDQKGKWLKVRDLEGDVHWVFSRDVSTKIMCTVVKTRTAKLRQGPGQQEPLAELSSVDRFTPFRKIDRDGEWVQVKDDYAATYWIHENNIWIPMARTRIGF